jgi:hypothetical protein
VQATLAQFKSNLHAFNDGQHSPTGIGAGVPSGQIFKSKVQATSSQFDVTITEEKSKISRNLCDNIRFIEVILVLHAFNDGQHSPIGTGAGVPSGQIFRSMVQ